VAETDTVTRSPAAAARSVRARIGPYELIREVGRGGMGTVYLARDTKLARRVAIKFLGDARDLAEARATARCSHENIVVIHEVDELEGQAYMVLEYLEGQTLRALDLPVPPSRAIELIVPVVRALVAAHAAGIVHRDLKPENILVTDRGVVKVLDFGIAKQRDDADPDELVGTPPYMAPEQWGADEVDHQADLWAVGIVLFELVTGHHPLAPATREQLLEAMTRLDEPMPAAASEPALDRVIARCLAKRKRDRFRDAGELLAALEPLLPRRRASDDRELAPYPGLTAFGEQDADLFHGRSGEVARLVALLRDRPLAALVGPSGAGKSSLVRAGLVPELKRREPWQVVTARPGRHPHEALAEAVKALTGRTPSEEPGALGELLRGFARERGCRVLLFVDQFEELYTLLDDAGVRRDYLARLLGAADDPMSPVRVVVSLRSDFLDRVDGPFLDALMPGIQVVSAADRDALRAALVEPARYAGYRFESDELVEAMVSELATTPGALPLLQFAATQLWEGRDRAARLLTRAAHDRIGGVAGALATHADAVIAAMAPAQHEVARRVLQRLVTPQRTRDVVELSELEAAERTVIDHLVAARLCTIGATTVELVHESLIERWPTLRTWLDHSQEDAAFLARVRTAARQWDEAARSAGLLWRGEAEADARRWSRGFTSTLGARERAFLDAVFGAADRATRVRRLAVAGTITALAALVVAGAVALVWIRDAETSAVHEAARAKTEAENARKANAELEAEHARQQQLLDSLQHETAAREQAANAATTAAAQVERGRAELERINGQLRAALQQAETASHEAQAEAARAKDEAERAQEARRLADEQRLRAEDLARKERERADRRGKLSTTLP